MRPLIHLTLLVLLCSCATARPGSLDRFPTADLEVRFLPGPIPAPDSKDLFLCGWAVSGEFTCVAIERIEREAEKDPSPDLRM